MRILQLHTGFNLLGGAETMVINLANEMSKDNDVTVCSVFKPSPDSVFYTKLSDKVKKVNLGVEKAGFSVKNILKVYHYLKSVDFDIVHFHGLFYYFALPILLTHRRLIYVYTFHSDARKEHGLWDRRIIWLKKFCLKHKWMYPVTISPQSQQSFIEYYGCESELILNGIPQPVLSDTINDVDSYRLSSKTKVFVHPGRICVPKNQIVLCRVFARLIDEGNDVVLLIAGSNQEPMIFDEMKSYLNNRIVYLGERSDIPELLARADGFCLPSIWEGLPVTLLEALSVGCIPICSPVGGIINVVVDGYNGFLSKSYEEEDYYQLLRRILSMDSKDLSIIKQNCFDSFLNYSIEKCSLKYISFFKRLIHERFS